MLKHSVPILVDLPEDSDYTGTGQASINTEGVHHMHINVVESERTCL